MEKEILDELKKLNIQMASLLSVCKHIANNTNSTFNAPRYSLQSDWTPQEAAFSAAEQQKINLPTHTP